MKLDSRNRRWKPKMVIKVIFMVYYNSRNAKQVSNFDIESKFLANIVYGKLVNIFASRNA